MTVERGAGKPAVRKKKELIDGVEVKDLRIIPDERGMLAEILRADDPIFKKFGQAYYTTAFPGVVKAWHYHRIQWDHFCCIHGLVKLVLYDAREGSKSGGLVNEFILGPRNMKLVSIPPGVYHGFKCIGDRESIMINIPTEPYNRGTPDEYRVPWDDPSIPYGWERRNG